LFANSQKIPTRVLSGSSLKTTLERANKGDTSAIWDAYEHYDEIGDKKNALAWIRAGSNYNDVKSQYQIYTELKDSIGKSEMDEAFIELERAAEGGYELAILRLGQEYKRGRIVNKNLNSSIKWLNKAVLAGDIDAVLELADTYSKHSVDLIKAYGYVDLAKALSKSGVYSNKIQTIQDNINKQAAIMGVDNNSLKKQGMLYAENLKLKMTGRKMER
jgi:TPR repeat protein